MSLPALALTPTQQSVVDKAKALVTHDFKDPASAQWRDLVLVRGHTLCGEVNAKNSYGAYVGFRQFYIDAATGKQGHPLQFNGGDAKLQQMLDDVWKPEWHKVCETGDRISIEP